MYGHPMDPRNPKGSPNVKEGEYDVKATNPKDAISGGKLPLDLVPDTAIAYMALAFLEGATKYGRYNWRIAGVRWSVYESALQRHRMKLHNGEWADPVTKVPHLASMMACMAILLDAHAAGKLIDDRPPRVAGFSKLIDDMAGLVAHVKDVFKDKNPKQYTIEDGVNEHGEWPGDKADQVGERQVEPYRTPREDVQSLPGRDSGRVVFGSPDGFVGGMEVDTINSETEYRCTCPVCAASPLAQRAIYRKS